MTKEEARRKALKKRDKIPEKDRELFSKIITDSVLKLPEYERAEKVFLYASFRSEVDTAKLIDHTISSKGAVFLPRVMDKTTMRFFRVSDINDLKKSRLGIFEPENDPEKEEMEADLFIIPLTAFSLNLDRVGYGGGYYDRYLNDHKGRAAVCALAFEEQLIPEFETERTDLKPDIIITQEKIIREQED